MENFGKVPFVLALAIALVAGLSKDIAELKFITSGFGTYIAAVLIALGIICAVLVYRKRSFRDSVSLIIYVSVFLIVSATGAGFVLVPFGNYIANITQAFSFFLGPLALIISFAGIKDHIWAV